MCGLVARRDPQIPSTSHATISSRFGLLVDARRTSLRDQLPAHSTRLRGLPTPTYVLVLRLLAASAMFAREGAVNRRR
jgi:hypothetical protein